MLRRIHRINISFQCSHHYHQSYCWYQIKKRLIKHAHHLCTRLIQFHVQNRDVCSILCLKIPRLPLVTIGQPDRSFCSYTLFSRTFCPFYIKTDQFLWPVLTNCKHYKNYYLRIRQHILMSPYCIMIDWDCYWMFFACVLLCLNMVARCKSLHNIQQHQDQVPNRTWRPSLKSLCLEIGVLQGKWCNVTAGWCWVIILHSILAWCRVTVITWLHVVHQKAVRVLSWQVLRSGSHQLWNGEQIQKAKQNNDTPTALQLTLQFGLYC